MFECQNWHFKYRIFDTKKWCFKLQKVEFIMPKMIVKFYEIDLGDGQPFSEACQNFEYNILMKQKPPI